MSQRRFPNGLLAGEVLPARDGHIGVARLNLHGVAGAALTFGRDDGGAGADEAADLAILDEIGLLDDRDRSMASNIMGALAGRGGRLVAISVQGFFGIFRDMEAAAAAGDPAVYFQRHSAPPGADLEDPAAWAAANPGLADGIVSADYLAAQARQAARPPAEQPNFRAFHLNLDGEPGREMIVTLDEYRRCLADPPPPRRGRVVLGLDVGSTRSLTAAAAYWYTSGRLEVWAAAPAVPDLRERGERDGAGGLYLALQAVGCLTAMGGGVTVPLGEFLADVAARLAGEELAVVLADRYRAADVTDALSAAGLYWPLEWRAAGFGMEGTADVRGFQNGMLGGVVRLAPNPLLESAIAESAVEYDVNLNARVNKARSGARIDALSASMLAAPGWRQ